jgi:hypothetical protein
MKGEGRYEGRRHPVLAAHAAICRTVESLLCVTRCIGYDMTVLLSSSLTNGVFVGHALRTVGRRASVICILEGLARAQRSVQTGFTL